MLISILHCFKQKSVRSTSFDEDISSNLQPNPTIQGYFMFGDIPIYTFSPTPGAQRVTYCTFT